MSRAVAPPGWPREVHPAGAPGWEQTAVAWLLDHCPPEFRGYPVLHRQPVVLARFAALHVEACQETARRPLAESRTALRDHLDPPAIEATVETWQQELARLTAQRRAVALVEEALRGHRYRPRL
jgi:hypothetical protein